MATQSEFKKLVKIRLRSAKILLDKSDWEGSGYFMGLALECALKASTCKTLRISNYPEAHQDKKVPDFFMTHSFLRLLLVSGLSDIFDIKRGDIPSKPDMGEYPFISSTTYNNGISSWGKVSDKKKLFPANSITVANNGSVGSSFYQKNPGFTSGFF